MSSTQVPAVEPGSRDRISAAASYLVAALVAVLAAVAVVSLSATQALARLGIPDPGGLTTYGLPALRVVAEGAAAITVGFILFAAFLVPPQRDGLLDVDGYRALRAASAAAIVWGLAAVLLVPLTLSDASGRPLAQTLNPATLWPAIERVELAGTWRTTAAAALVLAVACRMALRWAWTPLLLVAALAGLMPLALTGHSSSGGSHDMATNSLILHLVSASVWAGGLVAVLVYAQRQGAQLPLAARRFSVIAAVSFAVLGGSGIVNALVRVSLSDLLSSTYGALVVAKSAALLLLGVFGYLQRKRALPALAAGAGGFIRFASAEVLLLAATMGLAVGLGRTPPPAGAQASPSRTEVALGYDLAGPPTLSRLLFDWRFDLIFGSAAIVLAVLYGAGVWRLRARGDQWPAGRSVAWLLGCAVLLVTTSSGIGRYSPAVFSVHMGAHMGLSMLAPVLLVLGGPITLALRALPPAGRDSPPGPREWVLAAVHNPVSRFLTHPVVAAALFVSGFYALYLGGIFDASAASHPAHVLMNLHFLLSGYLFYWVVIGIDPAPRRVEPLAKLAMVFGSLPFHAFFGVALMSMNTVLAGWFYQSLGLGWNNDLLADQRLGGGIAWAAGEVPLVLVMMALLVQWSRSDERLARRIDRAADRDDDAELAAHNAMFAELARREREPG